MSAEQKPTEETPSTKELVDATGPDFSEARKMNNETFDTEEDDSDCSSNHEEEEEEDIAVEDNAIDILDQLVELFIERNGREPNQEEVMQWIDTFKSLQIDDTEQNDKTVKLDDKEETKEETPAVSE